MFQCNSFIQQYWWYSNLGRFGINWVETYRERRDMSKKDFFFCTTSWIERTVFSLRPQLLDKCSISWSMSGSWLGNGYFFIMYNRWTLMLGCFWREGDKLLICFTKFDLFLNYSSEQRLVVPTSKSRFTFSLSVLDLDLKPYESIHHQYRLDGKIVNYYLKNTQAKDDSVMSSLLKENENCTLVLHKM